MKKIMLFLILSFLPLSAFGQGAGALGIQPAWDNPYQNMGEGQSAPGYAEMDWTPDKILQVRLREGMVTIINFPVWETTKDAYIGESEFFDVRPVSKNTFAVTPVAGFTGSDTNMVVFGVSGNKYAFYLKSEPINSDTITHTIVNVRASQKGSKRSGSTSSMGGMTAIGGYAGTSSNGSKDYDGEDFGWIKSIPIDPTEFRFDLDIFVPNPDDYVIAPERVWRDKVFTYIDFGEKAISMSQRPVVSILIEGGEAPVSFKSDGPNSRLMIVEGIGDLVLRNGQRIVCIKKRDKPFLVSQYPTGGMIGQESYVPKYDRVESYEETYSNETKFMSPLLSDTGNYYYEPVKRIDYPAGAYLPSKAIPFVYQEEMNVAIELASANSISELQKIWGELIINEHFNEVALQFEPFYSVDTNSVDELGQKPYRGGEIFRLRLKSNKAMTLEEGAEICQKLSKRNINCNVVRFQ